MRMMTRKQRWVVGVLAMALFMACSAERASAQGFISPFIGYNFSGDSGCPAITNCEDKHANYGVAFGSLGSVVGFESEFAYTKDFFGATPGQSTKVITWMQNFMLAPRIGPVQPYGAAGVGLIRTSVEDAGSSETTNANQFGWNLGGGLIVFFSSHVGVRGDIRYFHSFQHLPDLLDIPSLGLQGTKLDYGRAAGALVLKF